MNESVLAMIAKLHARLDDLAEVVKEAPFELTSYEKRLDRIDDQVYLIEAELEKKLTQARPLDKVTPEQSEAFDAARSEHDRIHSEESSDREQASEKKQEGFLTDSAKETIAGATKTLNSLYKDGKEVVGEFSEAFGDIKEAFGKNPFKKR